VVTITLSGTGEYVLNQSITATWSATDALSGVVSPVSGTVSIDTSSVGTKTFTLPAGTAKDKAGNSSLKVTKSYSVIATTEEPVIEDPDTVYPQKWATGTGTASNPWANNCINKAVAACPDGGTVYLKGGYYTLSNILIPNKRVSIIGVGIDKVIIKTKMTNTNAIYSEQDHLALRGFTLDCDSQLPNSKSGINLHNCDYVELKNLDVKNAGKEAINVYEVNHSLFENLYLHDNNEHGIHSGSGTLGRNMYNVYQNVYCYNNGGYGFYDRGDGEQGHEIEHCHNVFDNIQAWDNAMTGISIEYQKSATISDLESTGNKSTGLEFYHLEDSNISNCISKNNVPDSGYQYGVSIYYGKNITLTNVVVLNNYTGIQLYQCENIDLDSCQSYDDRDTLLQRYGMELKENCSEITVLNCKLTPNLVGDIDNPYSVAIVVITEKKRLSKF
jgi:hypothetical protein